METAPRLANRQCQQTSAKSHGKFKEEDMTPDEFADYITAKSEQVKKELRERWS